MERIAGSLEIYSIRRNQLRYSTVILVSATYTIPLTNEVLYPAVKRLINSEPLLAVNVFNCESESPVIRRLTSIDLNQVTFHHNNLSLEDFSNKVLKNTALPYQDEKMPLWRLHVLNNDRELVFMFDHAVLDGNAGALFHKKLLTSLNEELGPVTSPIINMDKPVAVPKCLDQLLDIRPAYWYMFKIVLMILKNMIIAPNSFGGPNPILPAENAKQPLLSTSSLYFSLDSAELEPLLKIARNNGITLTALFYAAFTKAIINAKLVADKDIPLHFSCPVNARKYVRNYKDIDNVLGNMVFQYSHAVTDYRRASLLALAKDFKSGLILTLNSPTLKYNIGMLNKINVKKFLEGLGNRPRHYIGEISNLGSIDLNEGSYKVKIERLSFTQPITVPGSAYILNIASLKNGPTSLSITAVQDDDFVKCHALRSEFLNALNSLL